MSALAQTPDLAPIALDPDDVRTMSDQTTASDLTTAAVTALYDAFARRDVPAALACLADDIAWYEATGLPWGGLAASPSAVAQNVFAPALELFPDLTVTPEEIVPSGDTVIVVHRYTGTGKATGAILNVLGVGIWDVRDGSISRYRQFVDTMAFRAATQ
jgi:ketosteroid isomerase-like protein